MAKTQKDLASRLSLRDRMPQLRLVSAAISRNVDEFSKLVAENYDVAKASADKSYLMHSLCDTIYEDSDEVEVQMIRSLIFLGTDFNAQREGDGATPLAVACRRGNLSAVRALIGEDLIDFTKADNRGMTPFAIACQQGWFDIIAAIYFELKDIRKLPDDEIGGILNAMDREGRSPILIAAEEINGTDSDAYFLEIIKFLLEKNVNTKLPDKTGRTLESLALSSEKHSEVLQMLRERSLLSTQVAARMDIQDLAAQAAEEAVEAAKSGVEAAQDAISLAQANSVELLRAIESGDMDKFREVISRDPDVVDRRSSNGTYPLHHSVRYGRYNMFIDLFPKSMMVNEYDVSACTPLALACLENDEQREKIARHLLFAEHPSIKVDIEKRTKGDKISPLGIACERGRVNIVSLFDATGRVDMFFEVRSDGATPISIVSNKASEKADPSNYIEIARILKDKFRAQEVLGKNTHPFDKPGPLSAMYFACSSDNCADLVRILLEAGLSPNQNYGPSEASIFYAACVGNRVEVARALVENPETNVNLVCGGLSPMTVASRQGHEAMFDLLLTRGDIVVTHTEGQRSFPLMEACISGNLDAINKLLERGARVDINRLQGEYGFSPMSAATQSDNYPLITFLASQGADVNNKAGISNPLAAAARNGYHKSVMALLDEGADINFSTGVANKSPLYYACKGVSEIQEDTSPQATDSDPILGYLHVMEILLQRGCSPYDLSEIKDKGPILERAFAEGKISTAFAIVACTDVEVEESHLKSFKENKGAYTKVSDLLRPDVITAKLAQSGIILGAPGVGYNLLQVTALCERGLEVMQKVVQEGFNLEQNWNGVVNPVEAFLCRQDPNTGGLDTVQDLIIDQENSKLIALIIMHSKKDPVIAGEEKILRAEYLSRCHQTTLLFSHIIRELKIEDSQRAFDFLFDEENQASLSSIAAKFTEALEGPKSLDDVNVELLRGHDFPEPVKSVLEGVKSEFSSLFAGATLAAEGSSTGVVSPPDPAVALADGGASAESLRDSDASIRRQ